MTRIFDGHQYVHYGQFYVQSLDDKFAGFEESFFGQSNGLCGATQPGALLLITGLHTGHVGLVIDVLNERSQPDNSWEEIVEASFLAGESRVVLEAWGGEIVTSIPLLTGSYRVRYCARNMDKGHEVDTILQDEEAVDFYSLTLWPEASSEDVVIKQTSEVAAYWHDWVRTLRVRQT